MLGFLGASVEVVRGRAGTYGSHNRTLSGPVRPFTRPRGPDLTWQWTLSGSRRLRRARGRLKKRKYLNLINKISKKLN